MAMCTNTLEMVAPPPARDDEYGTGYRPHAAESPQQRKRRLMESAPFFPSTRVRKVWPEEMEDDYEGFGPEGGEFRVQREQRCFAETIWDRRFCDMMRSEFYTDRFRHRVRQIIAESAWQPEFEARFMVFAEAGSNHQAFVQLTLQRPGARTACCEACRSNVDACTVARVQTGCSVRYWALCELCEAPFVWIANCYSMLWAVARQEGNWPKQGFAAFVTPEFVHRADAAAEAYRALDELLESGVEAAIYAPIIANGRSKRTH